VGVPTAEKKAILAINGKKEMMEGNDYLYHTQPAVEVGAYHA
jgi:hypothetical protein